MSPTEITKASFCFYYFERRTAADTPKGLGERAFFDTNGRTDGRREGLRPSGFDSGRLFVWRAFCSVRTSFVFFKKYGHWSNALNS